MCSEKHPSQVLLIPVFGCQVPTWPFKVTHPTYKLKKVVPQNVTSLASHRYACLVHENNATSTTTITSHTHGSTVVNSLRSNNVVHIWISGWLEISPTAKRPIQSNRKSKRSPAPMPRIIRRELLRELHRERNNILIYIPSFNTGSGASWGRLLEGFKIASRRFPKHQLWQ